MKLLTVAEVAKLLRVSRVTVWHKRRNDLTFPRPIEVSPNRIRFREDELLAWLSDKQRRRA